MVGFLKDQFQRWTTCMTLAPLLVKAEVTALREKHADDVTDDGR